MLKDRIKALLENINSSTFKLKLEKVLFYLSLVFFLVAIYDIGFLNSTTDTTILHNFYYIFLVLYFISFSTRVPLMFRSRKQLFVLVIKSLIFVFLLFYIFNVKFFFDAIQYHGIFYRLLMSRQMAYVLIFLIFGIEISKNTDKLFSFNINPQILFVVSFFLLIMIGAGFLMMPNATVNKISFVDALFYSASAVSVTGLQIQDTAVCMTSTGQVILIILAQIGGLGVMTFTSFIVFFVKNDSSFKAGMVNIDIFSTDALGDAFKTVFLIVIFTFVIEIVGAFLIFFAVSDCTAFADTYSKVTFSIYLSISAYCNAGFSIYPGSMTSDLFAYNHTLKFLVATLCLMGGIGFPILANLHSTIMIKYQSIKSAIFHRTRIKHYTRLVNINTKLAGLVSIGILFFGSFMFFFLEKDNSLSFHDNFLTKILDSYFNIMMPRSAGFNDVDLCTLRLPSILLLMLLMFIGGSPVSTAGGIKTTTFGVAILDVISILQGKDRLEIFRRKIANSTVRQAFAVIMISFFLITLGVVLLSIFEEGNQKLNITNITFECISAFCTCGCSMGATGEIGSASKLTIIMMMFIGRVGPITMISAFVRKAKTLNYMYPKEKVFIG